MRTAVALICALVLSGCATDGFIRKEVVVKTEYVVRKATDQQKLLPPQPLAIDVATATQLDLAEWIVRSEQRTLDLEAIIRRLIEFYEKPVTEEERKKLEAAKPPEPAASTPK